MKKSLKRLMSAAMAASCMASAMAMNTSAIDNADDRPVLPVGVQEYLTDNGYAEFDDSNLIPESMGHYGCFSNGEDIVTLNYSRPKIYFEIEKAGTTEENFNNIDTIHRLVLPTLVPGTVTELELLEPEYDFVRSCREHPIKEGEPWEDGRRYYVFELELYNDAKVDLRAFAKRLSEIVEFSNFRYTNERYETHYVDYALCEDVTDYRYLTEKELATLQQYIEENPTDFADFDIETGMVNDGTDAQYLHLVPKDGVTLDQRFETAKNIQLHFSGATDNPVLGVLGIMTNSHYRFSNDSEASWSYDLGEIDVSNSIDGDANEDGEMNIADATAIVQAIGNPDKYALSTQGNFNADVDSNGLTGLDARAIQIKLINKN